MIKALLHDHALLCGRDGSYLMLHRNVKKDDVNEGNGSA